MWMYLVLITGRGLAFSIWRIILSISGTVFRKCIPGVLSILSTHGPPLNSKKSSRGCPFQAVKQDGSALQLIAEVSPWPVCDIFSVGSEKIQLIVEKTTKVYTIFEMVLIVNQNWYFASLFTSCEPLWLGRSRVFHCRLPGPQRLRRLSTMLRYWNPSAMLLWRHQFRHRFFDDVTPRKLTWQWKINSFNRRYTFKWSCLLCHASFRGGNLGFWLLQKLGEIHSMMGIPGQELPKRQDRKHVIDGNKVSTPDESSQVFLWLTCKKAPISHTDYILYRLILTKFLLTFTQKCHLFTVFRMRKLWNLGICAPFDHLDPWDSSSNWWLHCNVKLNGKNPPKTSEEKSKGILNPGWWNVRLCPNKRFYASIFIGNHWRGSWSRQRLTSSCIFGRECGPTTTTV